MLAECEKTKLPNKKKTVAKVQRRAGICSTKEPAKTSNCPKHHDQSAQSHCVT